MDANIEPTVFIPEKWDLPLQELYRLALSFYKQNNGKAIHLSYEDNLKLIAYKQQATMGQFNEKCAPELGVLDVIGRDRRTYWQMLGDISKEQAMDGFIDLLDRMCSAFRPYIEAVKQNRDETLKAELKKMEQEKEELAKQEQKKQELLEEGYKEEIQRRQLQDALNKQTYHQFKNYAEKQFPGVPEQQAILIHQLQQEHYHQYMQQLHIQRQNNTKTSNDQTDCAEATGDDVLRNNNILEMSDVEGNEETQAKESLNTTEEDDYVLINPAKMWTRPDIEDFKTEVSTDDGDGVITISHGDTVTVRVPTNANGKSIFWEFATDSYDIGFGVYFEWSKPVSSEVTVHVSDSDDDDEFLEEDYLSTTDDLECGTLAGDFNAGKCSNASKAPVTIIVPIYRRECFNEVYVGSHAYPGEGVYLLKFDNSYSIWRSKTLYYRVYYAR